MRKHPQTHRSMILVTGVALVAAACNDSVPFAPSDERAMAATAAGTSSSLVVPAGARADTIAMGAKKQLVAYSGEAGVIDESTRRSPGLKWASSHPEIASVDGNGLATAGEPGVARVVARHGQRVLDTLWVVVPAPAVVAAPAPAPAPTPVAPDPVSPPPTAPSGAIAELPRTRLNTAFVAPTGLTLRVASGGNLQAALDAARPGDEIVLDPGARFVGNFVLPNKGANSQWITIRSGAASGSLPAEGTRITPAYAAALPKLLTANAAPAVQTAPGTEGWRLVGLEISATPELPMSYGLVALGDASNAQNTLAAVPRRIIIDRSYIHGTSTLELRRCVGLNSASTSIVDSYLDDCHQHGFDSQAIAGWNGPGPFKITNNYLAAGHEVIVFGGSDPSITNLVPSDIEIRRNHITRPMAWQGKWDIKNLIEFKSAQRVLIESNVIENNWVSAQNGFAVLFWSVNQDGNAPWSVTQDVTFRYNFVRNVAGGFNLASKGGHAAVPMRRIDISQNVITGVGSSQLGSNGKAFQLLGGLIDIRIEHNTGFGTEHDVTMFPDEGGGGGPMRGLRILNNITGGQYTLFGRGGMGSAALATSAPDAIVTANIFAGPSAVSIALPPSNFPVSSAGAVALTTDYQLPAGSPYRGRATDGRDPGADIPALTSATNGVTAR